MHDDGDNTLPGLEPPQHPATAPEVGGEGPVLKGTRQAIATLRNGGWITDAHAHLEALAISAAQYYDHLPRNTKAYGHAQVTQALAKVFEMLPQPEHGNEQKWDEFMQLMSTAGDE